MELIHGGDVTGYELAYGRPPLDFSASLNPFGLPCGVAAAAREAIDRSVPYPDPLCRKLRAALADRLGIGEESIFCGNGAADVIFRIALARRPKKALLTAPTFAEYEKALRCSGADIAYHFLKRKNAFALGRDFLETLTPDIGIAFVCQPNNPTGQLVDRELLREILKRCEDNGTLLALDECFVPFVDRPEEVSLLSSISAHPLLLIIGSFTKLYAMAGLRLGYAACSDRRFMEHIDRAGPPWSVSTVAQAAGLAALEETAYVSASLAALRAEREWLSGRLTAMGIASTGSANFLFFHCAYPNLHRSLADQGILIRNCGNFRGLTQGDFRIAVRLRHENEALIDALNQALGRQ